MSTTCEHVVLDLTSEDEAGEWVEGAEDPLSAIVGVRSELAAGDLRPPYLAWLLRLAAGWWSRGSAGFENGLLTSRQLDVDDIKSGNAFKMADVRRCDAPACGDGRGGNDAVVRSDVRASRGQRCP